MQLHPLPAPSCQDRLIGFDPRRLPRLQADVVVVGGGLAGAAAALAASAAGAAVLLLTKAELSESNTAYAQGGIAAVLASDERAQDDSLALHIDDTLEAGAGLCDAEAVADILADAAAGIAELRRHGCRFDRDQANRVALTREGAHRARRILHADGDGTGAEIARAMTAAVLAEPSITVLEQAFAIDLVVEDGRVAAVLFSHQGRVMLATAGATVLATGGCGRVWRETTNPRVATGDGLAMAYRAGAGLCDLEFMQFHPTTLYVAGKARLLITEAMRGEGAHLVNSDGQRFMRNYHPDAELAPRDVVSTAIVEEIRASPISHVWLDATHLEPDFLRRRFPTIHRSCSTIGIDISRDWIPVRPSAHYHCGGIHTDTHGRSDLPGLFACGECAGTGLHGANRLASNSLLESLVVGRRAGQAAASASSDPIPRILAPRPSPPPASPALDAADLVGSIRALMWRGVGIEREGRHLTTARRSLAFWLSHQARGSFDDTSGWELQNLLLVANLVATAAEARSASIGTHRRRDNDGCVDTRHALLRRPPDGAADR